jgi:hypothetical protein
LADTGASGTSDSLSHSGSRSQPPSSTHLTSTTAGISTCTTFDTTTNMKPEEAQPTGTKHKRKSGFGLKPRNWLRPKSKAQIENLKTVRTTEKQSAKPNIQRPIAASANEVITDLLTSVGSSQAQAAEEMSILQAKTEFDRTVKWAASDMKKFYAYIEELSKYVDKLDRLTEVRPGSGMTPSSRTSHEDELLQRTVLKTQGALKRLHQALRAMNGRNYRISLRLSNDFEEDGILFAQHHDYLGALDEEMFFYFTLQVHSPSIHPAVTSDVSSVFVVETPNEALKPAKPRILDRLATNLDQASAFLTESNSTNIDNFERWGDIHSQAGNAGEEKVDLHCMFRDRAHRWTTIETLASSLSKGTPAESMTVNQRIRLALLVANSVLYLTGIRLSCQPITIHTIQYYSLADEEDTPWDNSDPLLLRPYIDFGFGQRQQGLIHGGKQLPRSLNPIIDLGLSLLQVGCCIMHQYDGTNPRSLTEARNWGQTSLKLLDNCLPVGYTELVEDCLGYESRAVPGQSAENLRKENEFLLDKVRRLRELDLEFHAATLFGSAVPKPRLTLLERPDSRGDQTL